MVDPAVHCSIPEAHVCPVLNIPRSRVSACLVKLTDSSLKQLKRAYKTGQGLSLDLQHGSQSGTMTFDSAQSFSFILADLSKELGRSCITALQYSAGGGDGNEHGVYESLNKLTHRLQVQATDEAFDQARETAQKLQEEDQKKQANPLNMKGSKTNGTTKVKQRAMQMAKPAAKPTVARTPVSKPASPETPHATPLQNEAMCKKPIRQRLVHLLILKGLSRSKLLERIMNEGMTEADAGTFDSTLKEISFSPPGKDRDDLVLKPSLYSEVDVDRWPAYGQWEKKVVRTKIGGGKKPVENLKGPDNNKTSIVDRLIPFAPSRKRTAPMPQSHEPKTTPEDQPCKKTTNENSTHLSPQPPSPEQQPVDTPPPPQSGSPPAINDTAKCDTTDWTVEYTEIMSEEGRDTYQMIFSKEYDEYTKCYERVKRVADEFRDLEERLNRASDRSPEYHKVEKDIVAKYEFYKGDVGFQKVREKHELLRAKLAVIKERVRQWDQGPVRSQQLEVM